MNLYRLTIVDPAGYDSVNGFVVAAGGPDGSASQQQDARARAAATGFPVSGTGSYDTRAITDSFALPVPLSRYSSALSAARRPKTSNSVSELDPSRFAPLMLTQAHSPAA